jgi:hypothetical protein
MLFSSLLNWIKVHRPLEWPVHLFLLPAGDLLKPHIIWKHSAKTNLVTFRDSSRTSRPWDANAVVQRVERYGDSSDGHYTSVRGIIALEDIDGEV